MCIAGPGEVFLAHAREVIAGIQAAENAVKRAAETKT